MALTPAGHVTMTMRIKLAFQRRKFLFQLVELPLEIPPNFENKSVPIYQLSVEKIRLKVAAHSSALDSHIDLALCVIFYPVGSTSRNREIDPKIYLLIWYVVA